MAGCTTTQTPTDADALLDTPHADSIARHIETTYVKAFSTGDTALLNSVMSQDAALWSDSGEQLKGRNFYQNPRGQSPVVWVSNVVRATPINPHTLIVFGTLTHPQQAARLYRFSHVITQTKGNWLIAAGQVSAPGQAATAATQTPTP